MSKISRPQRLKIEMIKGYEKIHPVTLDYYKNICTSLERCLENIHSCIEDMTDRVDESIELAEQKIEVESDTIIWESVLADLYEIQSDIEQYFDLNDLEVIEELLNCGIEVEAGTKEFIENS